MVVTQLRDTRPLTGLHHENPPAGLGQQTGGDPTAGPRADDHRVVPVCSSPTAIWVTGYSGTGVGTGHPRAGAGSQPTIAHERAEAFP